MASQERVKRRSAELSVATTNTPLQALLTPTPITWRASSTRIRADHVGRGPGPGPASETSAPDHPSAQHHIQPHPSLRIDNTSTSVAAASYQKHFSRGLDTPRKELPAAAPSDPQPPPPLQHPPPSSLSTPFAAVSSVPIRPPSSSRTTSRIVGSRLEEEDISGPSSVACYAWLTVTRPLASSVDAPIMYARWVEAMHFSRESPNTQRDH